MTWCIAPECIFSFFLDIGISVISVINFLLSQGQNNFIMSLWCLNGTKSHSLTASMSKRKNAIYAFTMKSTIKVSKGILQA